MHLPFSLLKRIKSSLPANNIHTRGMLGCKNSSTNWQISQKQNRNFMSGLSEVFETCFYLKHKSYYGTGELPETLSSTNPWATGDGSQPSIFSLLPRVLEGKPGCVRMESSQVFRLLKDEVTSAMCELLCVFFFQNCIDLTDCSAVSTVCQ